jgi:hypothetical protein
MPKNSGVHLFTIRVRLARHHPDTLRLGSADLSPPSTPATSAARSGPPSTSSLPPVAAIAGVAAAELVFLSSSSGPSSPASPGKKIAGKLVLGLKDMRSKTQDAELDGWQRPLLPWRTMREDRSEISFFFRFSYISTFKNIFDIFTWADKWDSNPPQQIGATST